MIFAFHPFWHILAFITVVCCCFFAGVQMMLIGEMKKETNPVEQCRKMNKLILPECIVYGMFLLISFDHNLNINTVISVIITFYNVYKLAKHMSRPEIYDPTNIHKGSTLQSEKRIHLIKLFCYLHLMFFQFYTLTYILFNILAY